MNEYCTFVAKSQLNFKTALISMAFNLDPNIRAFVSIFSVQF
jgi:hypothetical protein